MIFYRAYMIFYEGQILQFNQSDHSICYKQDLNSKIEYQLKLNCEETTSQKSRLSLKQIHRRVERIEHHLKKQNQQAKLELSAKNCLKFLLSVAKHWHNIGILLGIDPELTLEQIEADYPGDCQQCVREMIKSWLKKSTLLHLGRIWLKPFR